MKTEIISLNYESLVTLLLKDRDSKTLEIFPLDRLSLFFHTF
jgi:hypothetical protein